MAATLTFPPAPVATPPKVKPPAPLKLGDLLKQAIARYQKARATLGQIATNPHDEALYLLLRTLNLPLESPASVLQRTLSPAEIAAIETMLHRRLVEHTPAAYLTREAFLGDHRFYVDERALIPRSYFLEIIPRQLDAWLPDPTQVSRVADMCTGSGCLAILLAQHFPAAQVDAIDLSADALAVAKVNVTDYRLSRRIKLWPSDVFDAVPETQYDIILSNPPYEPSAICDHLPAEFLREPRLALDGGVDGLVIIRKLLRQARNRLKPHGIVLIEVGGLQEAMDKEFAALDPYWMHTTDGSNCVCLIHAERLKNWTR